MGEVQKYSLVEELRKADNTLMGSPSLMALTSLTYPNYINAMRSTMFTSHLKQFLNLENPDSPYMFTNMENVVGKYSHGYKKAKNNFKVIRKVSKFQDITDDVEIYTLFVFDEENHKYDVIERKPLENLTENFGYSYDNTVIDSLKEGDRVKKDKVLYHSKSYDSDMNYGYGSNVVVAYTLDPYTTEDAAVASRSLCEKMTSIETETITLAINNNDYLIDIRDDGDPNNYRILPNIGETVSDILAVYRRQFNTQLLYDFRNDVLREILDTDVVLFCDKDVKIVDYDIYCNADEWVSNPFYDQLNDMMLSQHDYYQAIYECCEEIMNSGYEYSQEIDYLHKRSEEFIDLRKKWRTNENNIFGNLEIDITVARRAKLAKGCKISG